MALGKSIAEVRAFSYVEYRSWELFYALEPFGWGAHHALLYNIHRGEKDKAKNEDDLLNDRAKEIITKLYEPDLSRMTDQEKRDFIKKQIKKDFRIK